jgi:hypothetical protein
MSETHTGKASDPEFRHERARKAAVASHATRNRHVKAIVDRAPELTPELRDRLAVVLRQSTVVDEP